jgi:hypothetical protein
MGKSWAPCALILGVAGALGCSSGPPCNEALHYIRELHCSIPPFYQRDPYATMCEIDVLRSCVSNCVLDHHPSCHDLYPLPDPNSPIDSPAYANCARACSEHD